MSTLKDNAITAQGGDQPTVAGLAVGRSAAAPDGWLERARRTIEKRGAYLAMHEGGRPHIFALHAGWSRIGRSSSADIRLDDPTVSRRHAVVVRTPDNELRVLDDRSTNGVGVNGETLGWSPIADGDNLEIGRYTLHVIEAPGTAAD